MNNKYHNIKTEIDNIIFSSRKEAARYRELVLMQRAGLIANLELQPRYNLVVNAQKICSYIGDFRYKDLATGKTVVEDVKGVRTPAYILKRKLMKAIYNIEIVEL